MCGNQDYFELIAYNAFNNLFYSFEVVKKTPSSYFSRGIHKYIHLMIVALMLNILILFNNVREKNIEVIQFIRHISKMYFDTFYFNRWKIYIFLHLSNRSKTGASFIAQPLYLGLDCRKKYWKNRFWSIFGPFFTHF